MIGESLKLDDQVFIEYMTLDGMQLVLGKVVKKSKTRLSVEASRLGSTLREFTMDGSEYGKVSKWTHRLRLVSIADGKDRYERQRIVNKIGDRIHFLREKAGRTSTDGLDMKILQSIADSLTQACSLLGDQNAK